jgi:hypothetical protein
MYQTNSTQSQHMCALTQGTDDDLIEIKTRPIQVMYCWIHLSPWWWRQYAPLKRRSTPTRLHGVVSQKAFIFSLVDVRFQVLTVASMKFRVFCDVAACSQTDLDTSHWWWRQHAPLKRRSSSVWLHGSTSQKTLNFSLIDVCACSFLLLCW